MRNSRQINNLQAVLVCNELGASTIVPEIVPVADHIRHARSSGTPINRRPTISLLWRSDRTLQPDRAGAPRGPIRSRPAATRRQPEGMRHVYTRDQPRMKPIASRKSLDFMRLRRLGTLPRDFCADTTAASPAAVSTYRRRPGRFSRAEISRSSQRLCKGPICSSLPSARWSVPYAVSRRRSDPLPRRFAIS
jgi:hypothetical protein